MQRVKYYDIGPYPVYFGFTTDPEAFKRELKRLGIKEDVPFTLDGVPGTTHHFLKGGKLTVIVCVKVMKKVSRPQLYGVLVHEAVHVWQAVLEKIGDETTSDEVEAYSIQNIAQWMIEDVMGQGRKP
jgi:hypothetical protein